MALRIGFVGTGGIAQGHMKRLAAMPEVELTAFADVALERAEKAAEEYGGTAYKDFMEMYDSEPLSGIVICVPPFAHGKIELEACHRGLHMLIEKPVAMDMKTALPIRDAVRHSGVAVLAAYKYRWDDHVIKAQELLSGRKIGLVFGNFWGGLPGVAWWRKQVQSGGQFVEQTTHIVDMARYLCGDIEYVQAWEMRGIMEKKHDNYDIADVVTANLRFENGAVGTISNTDILKNWGQSSLRVMAEEFTLQVAGHTLSWAGAEETGEYTMQEDGFAGEDAAFVRALQGDMSAVYSDYDDAVKTLAVSVAVNISASRDGETVAVEDLL